MTNEPDAPAQADREQAVTDEVVASFRAAPDARYRELMTSLVRHLHSFIREVRLTEEEWSASIDFLTRAGHITDDRRQEFILLSDVLGASMLTVAVNAPTAERATESTVFGPFFVNGSPRVDLGGDIAEDVKGRPCYVRGTVKGLRGEAVPGARIEVWECDEDGFYDVQYGDDRTAGRAHLFADDKGSFDFWSVRPTAYPIPDDGPVGDLLKAANRSPMRPAHLHFMVSAAGYRTLITHIFVAGEEHLDSDAVFGVKQSLVVDFHPHPAGEAPRGRVTTAEWFDANFDIILAPDAPRDSAPPDPAAPSQQAPAEYPPSRGGEPR